MAAAGAGQSDIAGYYRNQPSINKEGTDPSVVWGHAANAVKSAPGAYRPPVKSFGYDYRWRLFAGSSQDAATLFARFRSNPHAYFPFDVRVASCDGGDCSVPISAGNVLALAGDENSYVIGDVLVESASGNSFLFLALPGHIGQGGTIEFRIFEEDGYVYLQNIATVVPGSLEGLVPTFTEFAGKSIWSRMAAAFRCEHAYVGQEQNRRC